MLFHRLLSATRLTRLLLLFAIAGTALFSQAETSNNDYLLRPYTQTERPQDDDGAGNASQTSEFWVRLQQP